ncbi:MAG: hypothetical protein KY395_00910, partial [Actinobacteria bacterium]|nr:hypothetical protein [Actinomycetota bacterium]
MRTRLIALSALAGIALIASLVASPAQAAEKEFEGTLAAPAAGGGHSLADRTACPGPGPTDGTSYRWIDLEDGYTHFKVMGPQHLWAPSTTPLQWGDYDMDMYVYDDKCKLIGEGATPAGSEKTSTKRPARFVLIDY